MFPSHRQKQHQSTKAFVYLHSRLEVFICVVYSGRGEEFFHNTSSKYQCDQYRSNRSINISVYNPEQEGRMLSSYAVGWKGERVVQLSTACALWDFFSTHWHSKTATEGTGRALISVWALGSFQGWLCHSGSVFAEEHKLELSWTGLTKAKKCGWEEKFQAEHGEFRLNIRKNLLTGGQVKTNGTCHGRLCSSCHWGFKEQIRRTSVRNAVGSAGCDFGKMCELNDLLSFLSAQFSLSCNVAQ